MNEASAIVIRASIAYAVLLFSARVLGKQQISHLTFFDYVAGISMGSIAANMAVNLNVGVLPQAAGLLTMVALTFATKVLSVRSRRLTKILDSEPTIVIMNGRIMEHAMKKMGFQAYKLLTELRIQGVFDISEVEFAVLESNGTVSVLKKSQRQPVTPSDLNIPTTYRGLECELIYSGLVVDQNLKQVNLDRRWLFDQLAQRGIKDPSEVFLAMLNTSGELYIDLYDDKGKVSTDITDITGPEAKSDRRQSGEG